MPPDARRLEQELRRSFEGELHFDQASRLIYATDASIYEIEPLGVAVPRTREDLRLALNTAVALKVPVLPRGGGTSLAGQTVTRGLVIDCSKHLHRILGFNRSRRTVTVEPGIVLDNLNEFLALEGLHFAPDVATSSRANVGGMIGNNSAGVRSIRYGKTIDHVLGLKVLLATGEELHLRALDQDGLQEKCARLDREGEIYRGILGLVRENRSEIESRYPRVMRRVGGYNLDALLDEEDFNLAKLIVGSEGTLALVAEARLRTEPIPAARRVSVLHFDDLIEAIEAVPAIVELRPTAVEILDAYGLRLAKDNPAVSSLYRQFIEGSPEAILMVEFAGSSPSEVEASMAALQKRLQDRAGLYHSYQARDAEAQRVVWAARKNALGVLLSTRGDAKPLPFVEDACVPVEHLAAYIARVLDICARKDRRVALYAHASAGVIHVRPILNLKNPQDVEILRAISGEVFDLVRRYGGAWSGEHGDGLARSYKNREFFGDRLYEAFRQVKKIFDPEGLMNPGKIVDAPDLTRNLRIHPGYRTRLPETSFHFRQEQGFDRAVEMCTGVGACRQTLSGTMCPSYMATRDEEHSTRGRANALRMAMSGRLGPEGLTSHRLHQVLDLCLECKACKSECPSNVDMARLKSEFLSHYYTRHGLPLGKRLVVHLRGAAELGSRAPGLANLVAGNALTRWLLERLAGLDRRRTLPRLARPTYSRWHHSRSAPPGSGRRQVALLVDTFTNFFEPAAGMAATRLLEARGCEVVAVDRFCCGRTLISTGQLAQARRRGEHLLQGVAELIDRQIPLVVLEPSCLVTLRDDYPDLLEDEESARRLAGCTFSLEELVAEAGWQLSSAPGPARIIFHGHCQQKAVCGTSASIRALRALRPDSIVELDAGCCGMAGSFGYEKSHYGISEQIGGRRLFPALREAAADTPIVASGFSCRCQIEHFTGRRAHHIAEILWHFSSHS